MGTIDSKNIWEIDTIDRILAYSKRKENAFKFFKFDFQIASFSIQKTLKIYSDKVKMLSASTKDFWKILLNDRAKIIKKNSTSKKVLKIKELRQWIIILIDCFTAKLTQILLKIILTLHLNLGLQFLG